eukprot:scaffold12147_cov21-Cyclotella_meneghiniana.AAC.1
MSFDSLYPYWQWSSPYCYSRSRCSLRLQQTACWHPYRLLYHLSKIDSFHPSYCAAFGDACGLAFFVLQEVFGTP